MSAFDPLQTWRALAVTTQSTKKQVVAPSVSRPMNDDDLVQKARDRVAQCRRLARMIDDPHTRTGLRQMANEAEADIQTFEARRGKQDNERREA